MERGGSVRRVGEVVVVGRGDEDAEFVALFEDEAAGSDVDSEGDEDADPGECYCDARFRDLDKGCLPCWTVANCDS